MTSLKRRVCNWVWKTFWKTFDTNCDNIRTTAPNFILSIINHVVASQIPTVHSSKLNHLIRKLFKTFDHELNRSVLYIPVYFWLGLEFEITNNLVSFQKVPHGYLNRMIYHMVNQQEHHDFIILMNLFEKSLDQLKVKMIKFN